MPLKLYYAVKPLHINQIFGNPDPKYFQLGLKGHNGIDFMARHGQPVYASHDGTAYYDTDSYQGHGVYIKTNDLYPYKGQNATFSTIYWHFIDYPMVTYGQQVKAGDCIGFADSTGFSTGDHLHYGLKVSVNGTNIEQDNGFLGAIDPKPYFNNQFAEDLPRTAADRLMILGHQYKALGNIKQGNIVLAVAGVVKAFGG